MQTALSYKIDRPKLLWLIGAAALLFAILTAATKRKSVRIKELKIDITHLEAGSDFIKEADIKTILKRGFEDDIRDMALNRLDMARVVKVLEKDPFIEKAKTFIDANNALNIQIIQREPVLRVLDENGLNYYLDKTGFRIPPSKYFSARVPVATGAIPPYVTDFLTKKNYVLTDLFKLSQRIMQDEFLNPLVQQIYVNAAGEFTLIPILGDQKIILGNLNGLEDKLARLKVFYDQAIPYEGWNKYETINLKYGNQIVCKRN